MQFKKGFKSFMWGTNEPYVSTIKINAHIIYNAFVRHIVGILNLGCERQLCQTLGNINWV